MLPRRLPLLITVIQAGLSSPATCGELCRRLFDFSHRVAGWLPAGKSMDPDFLDASLPLPGAVPAERSYRTFHQTISDQCLSKNIRAGLDCRIWPATGQQSENWILCLANGGDIMGERIPGRPEVTCPPGLLRDLRDLAAARLLNLPGEIRLNEPASGSRLIRRHAGAELPWIRLDFAASPFLDPSGGLNRKRIDRARAGLEAMLALWCRIEAW